MTFKHFVGALAIVAGTTTARAGVSLNFVWGRPAVNVQVGTTVGISLYLRETVTGTSQSILLGENGLSSVGVRLTRQSSPPPNPAFLTLDGLGVNTVDFFDSGDEVFGPELFVSANGDLAKVLEFARGPGVVGIPVSPGVRQVLIGVITITPGTVAGQTTAFTAGDYDAASSDTITWKTFQVLDGLIATGTVQVTAVATCPSDFTGDGFVTGDDFDAYVNAFYAGSPTADFNNDGFVTGDDFDAYVDAFYGGC